MRTRVAKLAFNRGLVSRLGLARSDIKRTAMAAETHTNWIPRVLGSMSIRPGWKYLGASKSNAKAFHIPFIFSITAKASIEITNLVLRAWVSDALVTRASVSTAVTNGSFTSDVASWTDADEAGATSAWQTGGYLGLTGNGTAFAIRQQTLTVAAGDQAVEHALRVVIERGPVVLRVGTTSGDDNLITETTLGTGTHSLAFTPNAGSVFVELKSRLKRIVLVDSCDIEAAGAMEVTAPWAAADLPLLRYDQSGDIIYVACDSYQQYKIERRSTTSWSVVVEEPEDGPFRVLNVSTNTIAASATSGNITLTALKPLFRSGHVGALFQITSVGQTVAASLTAENTFSGTIRVTGVGTARGFTVDRSGTWVATVTLQRSFDEGVSWVDVTTYTTNASVVFNDGLDNQDILYRIGVKTGDFTSGTVVLNLAITTGSITGVVRLTAVASNLSASAEVIVDLGGTAATEDWAEGAWSDYRGYPSSVAFHEGRLGWAGRDAIDLSISDTFDGFDPDFEGDAAPISRTIGSGPVDSIAWMLSLQRLLLGGQGAEFSIRSSSLDEPLTATNFNIKGATTQGSAALAAVKIDQNGLFVQRGGARVYELSFGQSGIDYESSDVSALVPEIGNPSIVKMMVQRQPDTRVHCVRSDGTVAMLIFDKVEQVLCWLEITTDGLIEDVDVLPGDPGDAEDFVYYSVQRTINGATVRYREKWALESTTKGDAQLCNLADSFVSYTGVPKAVITGADHLEGEHVVIWADGADVGTEDDAFVSLPGVAGAYASTPDSAAVSITGDIDFVLKLAINDYTPSDVPDIISKDEGASNTSWKLEVIGTGFPPAGRLNLQTSADGSTLINHFSTVVLPTVVGDGEIIWVRATMDADNGAGGHDVKFYTSADGEAWTQFGDTITTAGETSLFDGDQPIKIGTGADAAYLAGKVYYAEIRNGIDGDAVMKFDPPATHGITSFTSQTGEVWTINGTALVTDQTYKVSSGGFTLAAAASNIVYGLPYSAPWKSAKMVELMENPGGSLTDTQQIKALGLILANVHAKGLKYGKSLTESEMDDLPGIAEGAVVGDNAVRTDYATDKLIFPGAWSYDARLCLLAKAPRPCTVLAALAELEHHG